MLDYLIHVAGRLGHSGYLVLILVLMLECRPLLGFVMPGESLVLVRGFLARQGLLDLGDLIVVISVAAILGDSIAYELGRHLGREWLLAHGNRFGLCQHLDRVDGFFLHHGGKVIRRASKQTYAQPAGAPRILTHSRHFRFESTHNK
jgi:undecaprenyl-diphosphatase